jgi:predicted YcjX-like family ATPase
VVALAAVRATREAILTRGRESLPSIVGMPIAGEVAGQETFDGATETITFPGDLPDDADTLFGEDASFKGLISGPAADTDYRFLRFRPPLAEAAGRHCPTSALDRALQFLLGDYLA